MSLYTGNSFRVGPLYSLFTRGGAWVKALATGVIELTAKAGQNITLSANAVVVAARMVFTPSTAQVVAAATTIQPNARIVQITSSGAVTMTSTPTIADGVDGQVILLQNVDTADSITIQDNATLANSGLRLTATTLVLAPLGSVQLKYHSGIDRWVQIGPLVTLV